MNTEMIDCVRAAYYDVSSFNELAGNLRNVTNDSIDNQIDFIFEELCETITAFEDGNRVELLDGACDLFVTVAGLMQKLEAQGYNVAEATARVNANNLSKFSKRVTYADSNNSSYVFSLNEKYGRYVIKDKLTGKVKKPSDFISVCLDDLVPKEVA